MGFNKKVKQICQTVILNRVSGGAIEKKVPLDLHVVDFLVEPLLVVGLELVRQFNVLTQDRIDTVVDGLEVELLEKKLKF